MPQKVPTQEAHRRLHLQGSRRNGQEDRLLDDAPIPQAILLLRQELALMDYLRHRELDVWHRERPSVRYSGS